MQTGCDTAFFGAYFNYRSKKTLLGQIADRATKLSWRPQKKKTNAGNKSLVQLTTARPPRSAPLAAPGE